jgi:hypothetical protein
VICLDVSCNGRHLCLAGAAEAIVQADLASGTHVGTPPRPGFTLRVTAADGEGLVQWVSHDVYPGDEVLIKVVEASEAEAPRRVLTEDEFEDLANQRGLLLARGTYAALKKRMRVLELEYGDQLRGEEDA